MIDAHELIRQLQDGVIKVFNCRRLWCDSFVYQSQANINNPRVFLKREAFNDDMEEGVRILKRLLWQIVSGAVVKGLDDAELEQQAQEAESRDYCGYYDNLTEELKQVIDTAKKVDAVRMVLNVGER